MQTCVGMLVWEGIICPRQFTNHHEFRAHSPAAIACHQYILHHHPEYTSFTNHQELKQVFTNHKN